MFHMQDFYDKIETKLAIICDEKLDTESTMKESMSKFPDDEKLKRLYEEFEELFGRAHRVDDIKDMPDDKPDDNDNDKSGCDDFDNKDEGDTTDEKEHEINPNTNDVQNSELEKGGMNDNTEYVLKESDKISEISENIECIGNPEENIFEVMKKVGEQLNGTVCANSECEEGVTQWLSDPTVIEAFQKVDSFFGNSLSLQSFQPSVDDNDMPSFSLGLSQNYNYSSPLPLVSFKSLEPLLVSFEDEDTKTVDKINDKRSLKPSIHVSSPYVCSPYINKKMDAKKFISKTELKLTNSLFAMVRDEM